MSNKSSLQRVGKVRDSNIELYRIISMLLIVAHHYVVNSGLTNVLYTEATSPKSLVLFVFGAFGKIGINCFVLITGYFMCRSQITAKKFAKLFLEVMFYKIVINAIFWITSYQPLSMSSLAHAFIPFRSIDKNFTGTYLVFFLCIPFLNKLIQSLREKQHLLLILLSSFIYVFFGTVRGFTVTFNYVSWYMVLYFIASYFRMYPKKWFDNTKVWGALTVVTVLLAIASVVFGAFAYERAGTKLVYRYVTDSNALLALLVGVCSFMFFKTLRIKPNRFINTISSTCFGVLLIHAHSDVMRQWLWCDVLHVPEMYASPYVYVHAVVSVLGIFTICCGIDLLRIWLLEKPFFKLWDKHRERIAKLYRKIESVVLTRLGIEQS